MPNFILGISSMGHDPAAALLGDGKVIAAIEEGKLLRARKSQGIPRNAIDFCLTKARIDWRDLDSIAVSSRPLQTWARQALFRGKEILKAPISSSYYQARALGDLARGLNNLRILDALKDNSEKRLLRFDHAICHAASAFYASPFDKSLILTLDEEGDGRCGLVASGEGTEIRQVHSIHFPNSLAWVYSQFTELLGFQWHSEEHKTQWLSLTGEPVFCDLLLKMLRRNKEPWPRMDSEYFRRGFVGQVAFSKEFYRSVGISLPVRSLSPQLRADLAASIQQACSTVVVDMLEAVQKEAQAKFLCLAGGLFLNPLLVAAIERNSGFEQVFVQPAAGNEGTALGAALLTWHQAGDRPRSAAVTHLDWGPSYSSEEIKQVLDNCKTTYRWMDSDDRKIEETLRLLHKGKIVAWFQGAAEFGPRALGNRSLLASPWGTYVKENLNNYVKHRESFRPFALCVPAEDSQLYFSCTPAGRFMATMGHARPAYRELMKELLLPGDLVRLHVVESSGNPLLWKLLKRFGETAPAPLLVNTSFNLFGEPLVVTPRDAVRSYFCSGTDALVIGNFVLLKT